MTDRTSARRRGRGGDRTRGERRRERRSSRIRHTPPSTATSYLHSVNREKGLTSELVNEGFGTNQLVFLFAKMYRAAVGSLCIEEPEIHLHPCAIARFVEVIGSCQRSRHSCSCDGCSHRAVDHQCCAIPCE